VTAPSAGQAEGANWVAAEPANPGLHNKARLPGPLASALIVLARRRVL
jgi:hypothetical protein